MNKELQQISKCLQDSVKEIAFLIRSNDPSKIGSISNTGNASGDKVKNLEICKFEKNLLSKCLDETGNNTQVCENLIDLLNNCYKKNSL